MKKLTAVVFVALALACLAPLSGATVIGLKGGLNLANMTIKAEDPADLPDFKSQPGLVAGVFVSFDLGPLAIQPELLYSRRGLSFEAYKDADETDTGRFIVNYLELPILLKYSFTKGSAKPFVCAGPSFAYRLQAWNGVDIDYVDPDDEDQYYRQDFTKAIKKTDLAGVFGAGVDIKLPKVILTLEGRYYLGLANINADLEVTSAKNKGLSVLVGLGF